ncbi:hypothetical protein BN1051_00442 [Arthrobacter saudimassiliensis]|uniref:Uncharacterized protein n=1 Tax=Arthrobacter saudimassiliensis TaxID=1461584 RepID=A0A078MLJ9_9MICC|nr:hypothetical protein BN1051_00442 [Arthrobacter saudimassiliensis]
MGDDSTDNPIGNAAENLIRGGADDGPTPTGDQGHADQRTDVHASISEGSNAEEDGAGAAGSPDRSA